jgi:serine/threonine-protein kinase
MAEFRKMKRSRWHPPVACDIRIAWIGRSDGTDLKIRVEAAALGNRPIAFRVFPPNSIPDRPHAPRKSTSTRSIIRLVLFALAAVGAVLLAVLQLRRGRGDRRGALRFGAFLFAVLMALWFCLIFRWPLDPFGFVWNCQRNLGFAAIIALIYFGVEPFVRRRTPQLMVSWARVLTGRWRDPLVGRDLLIGIAAGTTIAVLLMTSDVLIRKMLDLAEPFPVFHPFMDFHTRHIFGLILHNAFDATYGVFSILVVPLLLTIVLRKRWLAIAVLWVLGSFMIWLQQPEQSAGTLTIISIEVAVIFFVIFRYGLLAGIATFYAIVTVALLPGTSDLLAWNGRPALIGYIVLVLLALFGFFTSLARRRRFGDRFFVESVR